MDITLKRKSHLKGVLLDEGTTLKIGTEIDARVAAAWVSHGIATYGSGPESEIETAAADPEAETADAPAPKKLGRPRKVKPTPE